MKVIIAGGRDFEPTPEWETEVDKFIDLLKPTEIVSGAAKGADSFGEWIAAKNKIPIKVFPALWHKNGKRAGLIRNEQMAEYADALIALPGGRGTEHMIKAALRKNLKVFILDQ